MRPALPDHGLTRPRGRLRLRVAQTWPRRLWGLLLRRRAPGGRSGLLISRCHAVHTLGMAYPIAVWFIGCDGRVLRARRLAPWRWASCRGAVAVVETCVDILDAEDGGVGRIEAAVEHCRRRNIDRNLDDVGHRGGNAQRHQQAGAQVDEQKDHHPDGPIDQKGPFVAPAGNAREEQRLDQAQAVPADQHRCMPEQGRDGHVDDGEQQQRNPHGRHEGHDVVLNLDGAQALRQIRPERQKGQQPARQAQAGIEQAHEEQLAKDAWTQQRFGPHRGQHDSTRLDVLAGRECHERENRHQRDEQQRPDRRGQGREQHEEAERHGPEKHGQGLFGKNPQPVSYPLPARGRG
ncbi:hypothetical protein CAL22_12730 [Bordetella genomosp. 12]|uniref:DUF192 domain-containing protein n=1 Tax=Bordetella genomosp. 12 TaxID=463035 RepID=A0A261VGH4_9BORD|nr:hypothetical protein CAL22_12730 [Bordetella genomosp. 12]